METTAANGCRAQPRVLISVGKDYGQPEVQSEFQNVAVDACD